MAFPATHIIPIITSALANAGNATIPRGSRVTLAADGTVALSAIGVRGDYITLQDIEPGKKGDVAAINAGGSVPVIPAAGISPAVADPAYSAANGTVTNASGGGNVLLGKWKQASTPGALAVIELEAAA